MTVSKGTIAGQWSGPADSQSVAADAAVDTSLEFNLSTTAFDAQIHIKAKNDGTPASGDTVDFWLSQSLGDPDAEPESADSFATSNHSKFLGTLNTHSATTGEDPAEMVVSIPVTFKGAKLLAVNNGATAITVSFRVYESKVA